MQHEFLTCYNINLEDLGFKGLPPNVSYFKFEVGAEDEDQRLAQITIRYYPNSKDLSKIEEKKFGLVEL